MNDLSKSSPLCINEPDYSRFTLTMITITCMLIIILELFDASIVIVALPDIQGALNALPSTVIWVVSAFTTATALATPLTRYLSRVLGRKNVIVGSTIIFTIFSTLCGFTDRIIPLILFRAVQGAMTGLMVPLACAALLDAYGKENRTKALSYYGLGVMLGPIIGPVLSGYVTQYLNWHWIFFINIPFGIIAILLACYFISPTKTEKCKFDLLALIFASIFIVALEIFLSDGSQYGWFSSRIITYLLFISIFSFIAFLWKTWTSPTPIIELSFFRSRNYSLSMVATFIFSVILIAVITTVPMFLRHSFNYSPSLIGLVFIIMGIGGILGSLVTAVASGHIDLRITSVIGIILCASGCYLLSQLSTRASTDDMVIPLITFGFGLSLAVTAGFNFSLNEMPGEDLDEENSLFNISRLLGYSFGVTLLIVLQNIYMQNAWNRIGGYINPFNSQLYPWMHYLHLQPNTSASNVALARVLGQQALFQTYLNVFTTVSMFTLILLPIVIFWRNVRTKS
jgi:DHA2 family multidrug resistance protein